MVVVPIRQVLGFRAGRREHVRRMSSGFACELGVPLLIPMVYVAPSAEEGPQGANFQLGLGNEGGNSYLFGEIS